MFGLEILFSSVLLIALVILLPQSRKQNTRPFEVLKGCDWVGMVLFFVSSVLILIPINIGGTVQPWKSSAVIVCLIIGGLSLVSLIYHQRFLKEHPAFPKQIFPRLITVAAFVGSFISGMLLSMIFYYLAIFWEGVRHLPTLDVGVMLLAVTLPYALSAALTGLAIKRWGRIRWATITGTIFAELGLGLMYFMTEKAPVVDLIIITGLAATGCGIYLPAMINTILASTDREWHSHAIAMRTLLHTAGQCTGISIGLCIFTNNFSYQVSKLAPSQQSVAITPGGLMEVIKDLPMNSEMETPIVNALRWVWATAAIIAFIPGLPSCLLRCPALPEDNENEPPEVIEMDLVP